MAAKRGKQGAKRPKPKAKAKAKAKARQRRAPASKKTAARKTPGKEKTARKAAGKDKAARKAAGKETPARETSGQKTSAEEVAARERRAGPRWHLEFPVAYWDPEEQEMSAQAADLSASGLGFFVEVPAAVGAATKVRFTLPASKETFELMGTVRSASGNRIGIQFSEMDDLTSAQLLAAIFAELMASRPDVSAVSDPVDIQAMVERLARIENAIALESSESERAALVEEAETLRAMIAAHQKALAKLDS